MGGQLDIPPMRHVCTCLVPEGVSAEKSVNIFAIYILSESLQSMVSEELVYWTSSVRVRRLSWRYGCGKVVSKCLGISATTPQSPRADVYSLHPPLRPRWSLSRP